jgi:ferredoxin
MLVKSIKKADLERWLSRLSERAQLFVPQRRQGGDVVLGPWGAGECALDYGRLAESPKRLLLPQADPLFRYEGYRVQGLFEKRERVLFGLRPCDAAAMAILDCFFAENFPDPHYLARREHLALIVLACTEPEATCFCSSTGTGPLARSGFDLQLVDVDDAFLVQVATEKGEALVEVGREFFQGDSVPLGLLAPAAEDQPLKGRHPRHRARPHRAGGHPDPKGPEGWQEVLEQREAQVSAKFQVSLDVQRAAELVRAAAEPEGFWESVAKRCLTCGGCAFICPTCSCFELADIVERQPASAGTRTGESEGPRPSGGTGTRRASARGGSTGAPPQAWHPWHPAEPVRCETPPDQREGGEQPTGARQPDAGARVRLWDSCIFAGFTREASGHNPRQEQELRCARRYQHKLSRPGGGPGDGGEVAEPPQTSSTARFRCVGCGRCVEACLSSLGMIQIIRELTAPASASVAGTRARTAGTRAPRGIDP